MRFSVPLAAVWFCSAVLLTGPLPAQTPADDGDVLQQARELVGQLSSPSYAQRQSATDRLARLGAAARPALEEGLKSPQVETRLRVQRVLALIGQDEFERLINDFLADADADREHDLPAWPRFRELVGGDAAARQAFVAMLRAERDLLAAAESNPRAAATALQRRCQQLQAGSADQQREIDAGNLAALLFVASDERVPLIQGTDSFLYRFCSHSSVKQALESDDQASVMRKLVGGWVASGRGGYYGLRLALEHDLAEGLPAAENMLDGDTPSYYRQYAILTLAKLGDKSHIPRLEKLLADTTVCTTHRVDNETYQTQFRDIALVAILHLYGRDPRQFGFERARPHSQYVYSPYTLGFKDDREREAAFAHWEALRRKLAE